MPPTPDREGPDRVVKVAAVGDVHMAADLRGKYRPALAELPGEADVLLVAGDLTQHGRLEEAAVFATEFGDCAVPVVAVLGNHDHHSGQDLEIRQMLTQAGITVLEGENYVVETTGGTLGIAGVKGFCLGFTGRCAANFGEPEMKAFAAHGVDSASLLRKAFDGLEADVKVSLTHYSPAVDTLAGEPSEIWPFLGNYLLGEVVDDAGADLAIHGHAHAGTEKGLTDGGVPVRNVAQPVIGSAYRVYELSAR